jgi:hypothetical protein
VNAVYGLYGTGQAAQQAVNRLRAAGVADREITICSAQPMEDFEFGHMDRKSWMWWIACAGGLIGMSTGLGLSWLTETSWPIDVGGLPIFAWWPNLIITFELTMLGAILATVATLIVSARKILVGVEGAPESRLLEVQNVLRAAPGEIKSI